MREHTVRLKIFIVLSLAALLFLFFLNIASGSVAISASDLIDGLFFRRGDETLLRILWDIRMPRMIAAMVLGGALSVSGYLLQTFFGNPIAGPYVLGISSGSKLCVALLLVFSVSYGGIVGSAQMILAAFFGAMLSMGFVLLIAGKVRSQSVLVICGIMIGYICSAITEFVITFSEDSNIVNLHNWSQGSFASISWDNVRAMSIMVFAALAVTFFLSKPIGAYLLGESYAANMGVRIKPLRAALILLSSILSATVTAFAGPISFVGVAVPHIIRSILKTTKPMVMIPSCFIMGAVFCLLCDYLARMVFAPVEMNISSVTAVFGAPVVIVMMLKRKGRLSDD